MPVLVDGEVVHLLAAHPTPPTFDGPEDRNGLRNADETRLVADYLTPAAGGYIHDDAGRYGGLPEGARFVVLGDMNADPSDGDSVDSAIRRLLDNPAVDDELGRGELLPLVAWLRDKVHAQGSRHGFQDLLRHATGKPLDPEDFMAHLRARYLD